MEEVGQCSAMWHMVGDMLQMRGWKIAQQDLSVTWRLAMNDFWKVAYCEVNGVGCLVMKKCHLSFVQRYNNQDDSCTWPFSLNWFLKYTKWLVLHYTEVPATYLVSHHHFPVCMSWNSVQSYWHRHSDALVQLPDSHIILIHTWAHHESTHHMLLLLQ